MSRPRTPDQFPRMKVRGGRRRLHARIEEAWRGLRAPVEDLSNVFVRFEASMAAFADALDRVVHQARIAVLAVNWLHRRRARDQWLSRHMLTATPSPWAAPIRKATR